MLSVYDGASTTAGALLGHFSGNDVPGPVISTGRSLYLQFVSNDNAVAGGFRVRFSCTGTQVEYWKPADVATELPIGAMSPSITQASTSTVCISGVLASVQCCADAGMSCANARVTGITLAGKSLRGSIPAELGSLGALRSLKLHDVSAIVR
eukprot:COSAG06_NODE_318_length_17640_cov_41.730916_2_plen_152_part_00